MYANMDIYVAEETRQAEDLRQAQEYRLVRQAEKANTAGRKVLCAVLISLGGKLIALGQNMQEQVETGLGQVLEQAK